MTYHFKVAAINYVGTSAFSPIMSSFAAVVPTVPQNFAVVGSGIGSVTLSWTAPAEDGGAELLGYYIYFVKFGTQDPWSKTSLVSDDFTSFEVTGLEQDLKYSFKITAANVKGESVQSGIRY